MKINIFSINHNKNNNNNENGKFQDLASKAEWGLSASLPFSLGKGRRGRRRGVLLSPGLHCLGEAVRQWWRQCSQEGGSSCACLPVHYGRMGREGASLASHSLFLLGRWWWKESLTCLLLQLSHCPLIITMVTELALPSLSPNLPCSWWLRKQDWHSFSLTSQEENDHVLPLLFHASTLRHVHFCRLSPLSYFKNFPFLYLSGNGRQFGFGGGWLGGQKADGTRGQTGVWDWTAAHACTGIFGTGWRGDSDMVNFPFDMPCSLPWQLDGAGVGGWESVRSPPPPTSPHLPPWHCLTQAPPLPPPPPRLHLLSCPNLPASSFSCLHATLGDFLRHHTFPSCMHFLPFSFLFTTHMHFLLTLHSD